jgi:hypothetical protein
MHAYHNVTTQYKTVGYLNKKLTKVIGRNFCSLLRILMFLVTKIKIWKNKKNLMKIV